MTPVDEAAGDDPTLTFFNTMVSSCAESSFHEMTGSVGDVILLHPLMLHTASKNGRRLARIITNPPVSLKEPFVFDRPEWGDYSLVELKTIRDVGPKIKSYKPTGQRQPIIPKRLQVQAKWMEEENERLRRQNIQYPDDRNQKAADERPEAGSATAPCPVPGAKSVAVA